MRETKSKWLIIYEAEDECKNRIEDVYVLYNKFQKIKIGTIEKRRVGKFMHWCFCPFDDTYFTNGCLKKISEFITKLYNISQSQVHLEASSAQNGDVKLKPTHTSDVATSMPDTPISLSLKGKPKKGMSNKGIKLADTFSKEAKA